jgi:glycosyltransferase involved in cell wall biosynthesis
MKVILVRQQWSHHIKKSGYDRVFQEVTEVNFFSVYYNSNKITNLLNKISKFFFKKNINFELLLVELKVVFLSFFINPDIIHFCVLQEDLFILKKIVLKPQLIISIHLPPIYWKLGIQNNNNLALANKIIVLDNVSASFFKEAFKEKICMIPHAIDTSYFQPLNKIKNNINQFTCLFIGRFLRDIPFLLNLIRYCNQESMDDIHFHISFPIDEKQYSFYKILETINLENVTYYPYLSDSNLLTLYQTCDVLIQPFHDCTANNVILEAMACELPIIANDVGGIRTYFSSLNMNFLIKEKSVDLFYEKIMDLKNGNLRYSNDNYIQNFSLPVVKRQILDLYESVMKFS